MSFPDLPVLPVPGRGAISNPPNRFVPLEIEFDPAEPGDDAPRLKTSFFSDVSRTIITRNNSPDVGFEFSVNPYRGCEHGCIYCYARPTHEYFGLSAGLDFESKIFVKQDAPALLRRQLSSRKWRPATVALSGVTDPYQPIERKLRLTRGCLEVLAEFRNPVSIITKNHLVTRDIDLLSEMAADSAARVNLSITTLQADLQKLMEPRTSTPARRLIAVEKLASAGVPVGVMIGPVIPGLTDHELPSILKAAFEAGASAAGFIVLRLPFAVKALFEDWLQAHFPERKAKVLGRIRDVRGGKLSDPRFGSRMRGEGEYAGQIAALFEATCTRLGLNRERAALSTAAFHCPAGKATAPRPQLDLF